MSDKLIVYKCPNGHLCYPKHRVCSKCGVSIGNETVDLSNLKGTIITWTKSMVPPPGVRKPNIIAIVEYHVEGETVALLGGVEGEYVSIGDTVYSYCAPCGDANALMMEVFSISVKKVDDDYFENHENYHELIINDMRVDLAYLYVMQGSKYENLAMLNNIKVQRVPRYLSDKIIE